MNEAEIRLKAPANLKLLLAAPTCAELLIHSLMPPPTAPAGCFRSKSAGPTSCPPALSLGLICASSKLQRPAKVSTSQGIGDQRTFGLIFSLESAGINSFCCRRSLLALALAPDSRCDRASLRLTPLICHPSTSCNKRVFSMQPEPAATLENRKKCSDTTFLWVSNDHGLESSSNI